MGSIDLFSQTIVLSGKVDNFHLKFGMSDFPRTQMTKKSRCNICASAYLELRRVERLSSRRFPVRELGKRAALRFALDFESAFLVSSKARRFFSSSSRSRAPDFQVQGAVASTDLRRTPGLETADGPTDATYAKKADGRTWQCQLSQILHRKVVVAFYCLKA